MTCDMCGKESRLVYVEVEGTRLHVCEDCSKYGKAVKLPPAIRPQLKKKEIPEDTRRVKEDIGQIIKARRESMGLKQKELAKMLAEKESIVHQIESGTYKPSLQLAQKIERQLSVKVVEEIEVKDVELKAEKGVLTIGDMLKVK